MSLKQYLLNNFLCLLPPTRLYAFKRKILLLAGVNISSTARVVSSVKIMGTATVTIGQDTFIGHEVLISGSAAHINIGSHVDIAPRVSIICGTHKVDMQGEHSAGIGYSGDIVIEDGVWIGAGTIITAGVTIGRKAVVAAGSVVTTDIPAYCVAAGVPCRPKKFWSPETQQWVA